MKELQDYKKFAVLYVDDEEKSLKSFARAFGEQFWILTAPSAEEGFRLLEEYGDRIGVLLTDQRMPGEQGVRLLERARQTRPQIVRVLATAYADLEAVIAAVNSGAIYKYISKPWDPPQLEVTLKRGLDYFIIQRERDQLLLERTERLKSQMVADRIMSLGLLAAGMSHHIRNSLVAVKTFLDLVPSKIEEEKRHPKELRNPEFWQDYLGSAQRQVEKINGLLKDLWLASEKAPVSFPDQVEVDVLLNQIVSAQLPAFAAKQLTLECRVPAGLPKLLVDKPKFARLIELLLGDELVSLPPGTKVTVLARLATGGNADNPEVEIELQDNGPGLKSEDLRLVFDPFMVRSDSPQEYGISLMACYFIVHHHRGRIEARHVEPHGTSFIVRLPSDPNRPATVGDHTELLRRAMLNQGLWQEIISK